MPIRVHTVEGPLLTSSAPQSGRRTNVVLRQVGEDLLATVRHSLVVVGPLTPRGTLTVRPDPPTWHVVAGTSASVTLTIRNVQSSLVIVSPALRRLLSAEGTEWSPAHRIEVSNRLLPPGATTGIRIELILDPAVPAGTYAGSLVFLGSSGSIPLRVVVGDGSPP